MNLDIRGINIKNQTYKLAAFADDLLLFLTDPHISLPKNLKHFQMIFNLKINHSKSNALNITLPPDTVSLCQKNFPFTWAKESITYLGIKIPTSLSDCFQLSFDPILKETREDLKRWNSLNISWFGRASLLKMTILPRFLYMLQTIPITMHNSYFAYFRRTCSSSP